MAFSSRYANLSCLFWLSWLVPAVVLVLARKAHHGSSPDGKSARAMGSPAVKNNAGALDNASRSDERGRPRIAPQEQPYVRAATALTMTVLLVSLSLALLHRGDPKYRSSLLRAKEQPLAALAAHHYLSPEEFYTSVTKWPWGFQRVLSRLEALHHVPFDRPPETQCGALIDAGRLEQLPKNRLEGRLERTEVYPNVYLIEGWLQATDLPPIRRVLFLDPDHRARGFAFSRSVIRINRDNRDNRDIRDIRDDRDDRDDVADREGPRDRRRTASLVRWLGMVRPMGVEPLSAWVQFEGQESLVRLRRVRFDVPGDEAQRDPPPAPPDPR
jgi:hypothetical protein